MPPSQSWQTVTATGQYRQIDGTPHNGKVRFTFLTRVTNSTDDVIFPAGSYLDAPLDGAGRLCAPGTNTPGCPLPVVDDPAIQPTGWVIKVEEKLAAGGGLTYYIAPTLAMVPTGLDLRKVVEVANPVSVPAFTRGVPGGLAELDVDGDVVNARGQKVAGSGTGALIDDNTPSTHTAFSSTETLAQINAALVGVGGVSVISNGNGTGTITLGVSSAAVTLEARGNGTALASGAGVTATGNGTASLTGANVTPFGNGTLRAA